MKIVKQWYNMNSKIQILVFLSNIKMGWMVQPFSQIGELE